MSEKKIENIMLYDFFGELLTEKQRKYFDLYYNEDLSLSEIAQEAGISRQGVYDIITRAERTLTGYEDKTGVVKRWRELQGELERTSELISELISLLPDDTAKSFAEAAYTRLSGLKG